MWNVSPGGKNQSQGSQNLQTANRLSVTEGKDETLQKVKVVGESEHLEI